MKILVCVKQVADMESKFRINSKGNWIEEKDLVYKMNEYDEFAVEEAIALKEKLGQGDVTVLSLGPERVKEAIKKALAMGADRGIHIVDDEYYLKDPYLVASIIYNTVKEQSFDLIFLGMQSQDRASACVGVFLSEMLQYNCVTTVTQFEYSNSKVTVRRELEGGIKMVVELDLPAVVTVQLGLNTPRYPTLPNIMKAKKKPLEEIKVEGLLKDAPMTTITKVAYPEKKGQALILEGDVSEVAEKLIKMLKEKALI